MINKQFPSEKLIIGCLDADYGIEAVALTHLPWGADSDASVYRAETGQGPYFVKVKRGRRQEVIVAIVEFLYEAGIRPVIPPVKTIDGGLSRHIGDCTLIVYPFVEGQDGFHRKMTDNQWIELGRALRQVHEMEILPEIQGQIRRETYSPKWREAVRALLRHIESEPVGDEAALKLWKLMRENKGTIRRLLDRAEELGQKVKGQPAKFVLCHSDIHGGNVLMDKETFYIVDWDDPIMAPKERDLMFIGGDVGNVWNDPREEKLFYQGYGKTEIDRALLAYYRHERIVEDIALFGQDLLLTAGGGKDRTVMVKHFIDMFEPRGVVDLAFKTNC